MKIAILCEDFSVFGGREKVAIALSKEFDADIITFSLSQKVGKNIPSGVRIKSLCKKSQDIEDGIKRYFFSNLNLSKEYDFFIILGYHASPSSKLNSPNIFYVDLFPEDEVFYGDLSENISFFDNSKIEKFFNDLYKLKSKIYGRKSPEPIPTIFNLVRYFCANNFDPLSVKSFFYRSSKIIEGKDLKNIDKFISNSQKTAKKFKEAYGVETEIIYPFVNVGNFNYSNPENYWVSINRIHPQKKIEIQIESFRNLPNENLYIIGEVHDRDYFAYLRKISPNNVFFLGNCSEKEVSKFLSKCKGLITTSKNESFGMNALEAMASGKPVIAPNEGGYKETIISGETGVLINDINPDKIVKTIEIIGKKTEIFKDNCIQRANQFSFETFVYTMKQKILEVYHERKNNH